MTVLQWSYIFFLIYSKRKSVDRTLEDRDVSIVGRREGLWQLETRVLRYAPPDTLPSPTLDVIVSDNYIVLRLLCACVFFLQPPSVPRLVRNFAKRTEVATRKLCYQRW